MEDLPKTIFDALPESIRKIAKEASDNAYLSGAEPVVPRPEELALATVVKCSFPGGCNRWAELGDVDNRCPQHKKGRKIAVSHLYDAALQQAPSLASIQESIRERGDFDSIDDDIILIRALTTKFIEKNSEKLEEGQYATIVMAQDLINKASLLIERRNGKKYTVTLTGINVIIQQIVSILELHLQPEPALLEKIAVDISQIKLPQGSLSK